MSQTNRRILRNGMIYDVSIDENEPILSENRPSRKRKDISRALEDISNSQETPNKIACTESSDHVFLQKIESHANTEPMDEDESGIEASSSCLEPAESSLRMINTHKLLLDENHQVIGIVEEIPFNAGDNTTVECLELTCADENEISFNEVVSSSQQSTCSSLLEDTGSFNPVSEHAIMRIMDYLNIPDRLNLSLTSKRFQTILKDNPNRFPLTLALDYEDKEAAAGVFTRCYRTVKVQELKTPDTEERIEEIKETFKSIGSGIRDIQFLNCNLSFQLLSSLITMMPNIISLQMENTILKPSESDVEWPALPALKKVNVNGSNIENISKVLQHVTTIEEFVFSIPTRKHTLNINETDEEEEEEADDEGEVANNEDVVPVVEQQEVNNQVNVIVIAVARINNQNAIHDHDLDDFVDDPAVLALQFNAIKAVLARQVNLATLEVIRGSFFAHPFDTNGIQLKKLVLFIPSCTPAELRNMKAFVKSQTQLESVVLNVLCQRSVDFNDCFDYLVKLRTLNELRIVFYDEQQMTEHYRNYTFVNANVKDVYLGLQGITQDYQQILTTTHRLFPCVNKLHLNMDSERMFQMTLGGLLPLAGAFNSLADFKHLETLTIDRVMTPILREIRNPTLKSFTATGILYSLVDDWTIFFRNNPAIENLRIQLSLFGDVTLPTFLETAVANLPKIKTIKVCSREGLDYEDDQRMKQLFDTSSSLKSITFCRFNLFKVEENRVILRKNSGKFYPFPRENGDESEDSDE